jgi:hypothetical protein
MPKSPGSSRLRVFRQVAAAAVLAAGTLWAVAEPPAPASLDKQLRDKASSILAFVDRHAEHPKDRLSVGVLKFLVKVGEEKATDNAGLLNLRLARRLEAALILALDPQANLDPKTRMDRVRILHDPSSTVVAQKMRRASHLKPEGRRKFFDEKYPAAWGDESEKLPADAFLTGVADINRQTQQVTVKVQAFDKKCKDLMTVCEFTAPADARTLSEAGVTLAIPRGPDPDKLRQLAEGNKGGKGKPAASSDPAVGSQGTNPLVVPPENTSSLLKLAPIQVQIRYDGKEQDIRSDGTVPEPKGGKVSFLLSNKRDSKKTYGVLLCINGHNSIRPDVLEPADYRSYMWILRPGSTVEVKGYQIDDNNVEAFKVASPEVSREMEVSYDEHAGSIRIAIFEARDKKDTEADPAPDQDVALARGLGSFPTKPLSLEALRHQLTEDARAQQGETDALPRGLIVRGEKEEHAIKWEPLEVRKRPDIDVTVLYYQPQGGK